MIELPVTLTSTGGAMSFASPVPLGYTKNKGVYRLLVTAEGEWQGLTIRCFWHLPGGTDPASSLVQDGFVDVPASVTAHPGNGCITFEGSDGEKTVTSADLRYRVGSNSGTEDGIMPEPGTPAWEQLVSETKANADAAERAKNDAQAAAEGVKTAAAKADEAAQKAEGAAQRAEAAQKATEQAEAAAAESIAGAKKEALSAISTGEQGALGAVQQAQTTATEAVQAAQTAAESAVNAAKTNAVQEVEAAAKPAQTAAAKAEEAAELSTQAGIAASNAADDAKRSAGIATGAAGDSALNAENAQKSALSAQQSAENAAESQSAAAASADAAAKSAQEALESKTAAATSEGNAAESAKKAKDIADSLHIDYTTAVNEIAALKTNKADKTELKTVKQQVENITPDDSSIGDKPWSSKHIIDMLCPPLEASGNPVVCYPVAGYSLGVKASWEPVQEGSGTPYPAGGGKNLFNPAWMPEKAMDHGVTWATTPDGTVTANGTSVGTTYYNSYNFLLPAGTYTISAMSHFRVSILNNDTNDTITAQNVGQPRTFTVENDIQNARLFFAASDTLDNVAAKPQIEKGATATAYAPYENIRPIKGRESVTITRQEDNQVITLTLPETVCGGEVDAVTGDGKRTWKMLTLDGTTNAFTQGSIYWNLPMNSAVGIGDWYLANIYCSHFYKMFGGNARGNSLYTTNDLMTKYFPNTDALNAYLAAQYAAGTPVQVCYKLAEPMPFSAAGAQPLPALAGANTVLTDADSVTVTGRADPIKRIEDLKNKE